MRYKQILTGLQKWSRITDLRLAAKKSFAEMGFICTKRRKWKSLLSFIGTVINQMEVPWINSYRILLIGIGKSYGLSDACIICSISAQKVLNPQPPTFGGRPLVWKVARVWCVTKLHVFCVGRRMLGSCAVLFSISGIVCGRFRYFAHSRSPGNEKLMESKLLFLGIYGELSNRYCFPRKRRPCRDWWFIRRKHIKTSGHFSGKLRLPDGRELEWDFNGGTAIRVINDTTLIILPIRCSGLSVALDCSAWWRSRMRFT